MGNLRGYWEGTRRLPLKIVSDCIRYYEENDIFLEQTADYANQKHKLIDTSKGVKSNCFQSFIYNTRGISYTNFLFGKESRIQSSRIKSQNVEYDFVIKQCLYIKIPYLTINTARKAIQIMTEHKNRPYLILDLRNSVGGYIEACVLLCRELFPNAEIVTLNYRNKRTTYFSEGKSTFHFNGIYIFINESTASSCEILALFLRLNADNVKLIGKESKGKSCGQDYIINKKFNYTFIVTSFYWEVNGCTTKDLQLLIKKDVQSSTLFNRDEDYFQYIFNDLL